MSKALMKRDFRAGWKLLAVFLALGTMYISVITNMYDPKDASMMQSILNMKLSQNLLAAFGFTETLDTSLTGFLVTYFYGFLMPALPMVYAAILANQLVAQLVDRGSMATLLAAPLTRGKVARTQGFYLLLTTSLIIVWIALVGMLVCQAAFPGMLSLSAFLRVNLGALLLHAAISGICFFFSCLFNDSPRSLGAGAGLMFFFLLIKLLLNSGAKLAFLRYLSIYSLYDAQAWSQNQGILLPGLVLLALALLSYLGGLWVFDRKDIPV